MIRPSQTIRRAIRTICCVLLAVSPCMRTAIASDPTISGRATANVRNTGVLGLDLPNVSEEFLTHLGYSFVAPKLPQAPAETTTPAQQTVPAPQTQQTAQQPPVQQTANEEVTTFNPNGHRTAVGSLIGTWVGFGVRDGDKTGVGLAINGDGSFKLLYQTTNEDQTTNEIIHVGTWGKQEHKVVFTINGTAYDYEFEFTGDKFKLCILGGDQVITMFRQP